MDLTIMDSGPVDGRAESMAPATGGNRVVRDRVVVPLPQWWHTPEMVQALAERDIGAVFRMLQHRCLSQRRIAALTHQSQSEVSEILAGRRVAAYSVLVRISDGLGIPRTMLGLARAADPIPAAVSPQTAQRAGQCLVPVRWTGREVKPLRHALRMTVREFGAYLGVSDRMISKWEAVNGSVPRTFNQAALDEALRRAHPDAVDLYARTLAQTPCPGCPANRMPRQSAPAVTVNPADR